MADTNKATDGPGPYTKEGFDSSRFPDYDTTFITEEELSAFEYALKAPDLEPISDDASAVLGNGADSPLLTNRDSTPSFQREGSTASILSRRPPARKRSTSSLFITSKNDWAPVHEKVKRQRKESQKNGKSGKTPRKRRNLGLDGRSTDETREGYLYSLLKWPMLFGVGVWVTGLSAAYLLTRLYIWMYEYFIAWRGTRHKLRQKMTSTDNYEDYIAAAKEMDSFLGNDKWKDDPEFAYYDHKTIKRVLDSLKKHRRRAEAEERYGEKGSGNYKNRPVEELRSLVQACVKNNFVGVESSRLYSQTYYGTKTLVQEFIEEGTFTIEVRPRCRLMIT
jgi:hypothetical protein